MQTCPQYLLSTIQLQLEGSENGNTISGIITMIAVVCKCPFLRLWIGYNQISPTGVLKEYLQRQLGQQGNRTRTGLN
jgi:hypothetical protein